MHTDVFDLHGDHRVYQLTGVLCRKFRTVHILYPFQVEFQLCLIRNLAFRGFVNWDTCWRGDPVSGLAGLQELHIGLSVTLPVGLLVPLCSSPGICLWLLSLPHSALLGALLLLLPATKAILDPGPLESTGIRDGDTVPSDKSVSKHCFFVHVVFLVAVCLTPLLSSPPSILHT